MTICRIRRQRGPIVPAPARLRSCGDLQFILGCFLALPLLASATGCERPMTSIELLERGIMLAQRDQFPEALDNFDRSIELVPENPDPYYERAVVYARLDKIERALEDYDQAIRLHPEFVQAYVNRGRLFAQRDDHERALADFTKAIHLEPRHVQALQARGAVYRELKRFDNAISDLTRSIDLEPTAQGYYWRGNLLMHQEAFEHAVLDFDRAIELDAALAKAWLGRAIAHCRQGRKDLARADLLRAAQLDTEIISNDILSVLNQLRAETSDIQVENQQLIRKPSFRFSSLPETHDRQILPFRVYRRVIAPQPLFSVNWDQR